MEKEKDSDFFIDFGETSSEMNSTQINEVEEQLNYKGEAWDPEDVRRDL